MQLLRVIFQVSLLNHGIVSPNSDYAEGRWFSPRSIADALTNDCKPKKHKGFRTLQGAVDYLKENGYGISDIRTFGQEKKSGQTQPETVYAVVNGREGGTIHQSYT